MTTPYITPDILTHAPTGISWATIPSRNASPQDQLAEQTNICWRASATIDQICGQVLRATSDIEELAGPDLRVTVQRNYARVTLSRWPVLSIVAVKVSASAAFPPAWSVLPAGAYSLDYSTPGVYGSAAPDDAACGPNAVVLQPGYIDWTNGRNGYRVHVEYVNGWPHAGITANAEAAATSISVDDCTGWSGVIGTIFDGENTESVTVESASAVKGPGILTLTSGLLYAHSSVMISSMPESIHQAAILLAASQALTRGATATTVQQQPGSRVESSGGSPREKMIAEAKTLLQPFRRVF